MPIEKHPLFLYNLFDTKVPVGNIRRTSREEYPDEKVTLTTRDGAIKVAALFLAAIVLFSFAAQLISTQAYKITISDIVLDIRGGDLHMELYRPANASSQDKLPAILLTHGGSESLAADSMMAWELARRGFVVLNISAYGAGLSDQPNIVEDGTTGMDGARWNRGATMGMWDALQYAKSLAFVDPTRIGSWAHSTGRHLFTKVVTYYGQNLTLNDRMLNVLYNEFGITITEDQLTENADDIAAQVLTGEQLAVYGVRKAQEVETVSTYMKAARLTERGYAQKAKVAGFDVIRDPQMNLICGLGTHEGTGSYYLGDTDQYKGIFHTSDTVQKNSWYAMPDSIHDPEATATLIGEAFDVDVNSNEALKNAIDTNTARFFLNPVTMHNGNLWSPAALTVYLDFYTQAMGYNNGELSDPNTQPIDCKDLSVSFATLILTSLSTFAAIGLIVALAAYILRGNIFASCRLEAYAPRMVVKSKDFILWVIATAVTGFMGAWGASMSDPSFTWSNKTMTKWLPWEPGQVRTYLMLIHTVAAGVALFIILGLLFRKKDKSQGSLAKISQLNPGLRGVKNVLKTLGVSVMLFAATYACANLINTFFDSRFLVIDGSFELMKGYSFGRMFRYALIVLPGTLVISGLNNMVSVKNVKDGTDTFINVLVTSLGMLLFVGIAYIVTYSTPNGGDSMHIQCILSIIPMVPMFNYLYRKLFKVSGSIWLGAFVVALLIGWRLAGYISHQFMWYGNNEIAAFFGIY